MLSNLCCCCWCRPIASVTRYWSKNVAQTISKVAQIDTTTVFTLRDPYVQNSPRSHQCFWATFVSKFVAKNFQKSPKLVALPTATTHWRPKKRRNLFRSIDVPTYLRKYVLEDTRERSKFDTFGERLYPLVFFSLFLFYQSWSFHLSL